MDSLTNIYIVTQSFWLWTQTEIKLSETMTLIGAFVSNMKNELLFVIGILKVSFTIWPTQMPHLTCFMLLLSLFCNLTCILIKRYISYFNHLNRSWRWPKIKIEVGFCHLPVSCFFYFTSVTSSTEKINILLTKKKTVLPQKDV